MTNYQQRKSINFVKKIVQNLIQINVNVLQVLLVIWLPLMGILMYKYDNTRYILLSISIISRS